MPAPFLLNKELIFPDPSLAMEEPDGLLAVGGDLSPQRLLFAYEHGIFPWYNEDEPILWWSPNPRAVLTPGMIHISRSLKKAIRKNHFTATYDQAFAHVMEACAQPRAKQIGTWINEDILDAYITLHRLGHAHSVEIWQQQRLVGGLYGIAIGRVFFGESMFSLESNASKAAFAFLGQCLKAWNYKLIDCQVSSEHMSSLGARDVPRPLFIKLLKRWCPLPPDKPAWSVASSTS